MTTVALIRPRTGTLSAHQRGTLLALVSATGFGAMGVLAKLAFASGVSVATLLSGRFMIAAVLLWAIVAARRTPMPPLRTLLAGLALGVGLYGTESGLAFLALQRLDASLFALLLYTYPVIVVAGAVALGRERLDRARVGALATALSGAGLVILGAGTGALDGLGVALALSTAVIYSVYVLVADGVTRRVDPLLLAALVSTGAALTITAAGVATSSLHAPTPTGALLILALAVVCTVVPISAFLLSLPLVGASTASILNTLEPVVACGLAAAVFGESLGPVQLAGGSLVILAVVALQVRRGVSVRADDAAAEVATPAPARQRPEAVAGGGRLGVRTEVGRLSRNRVRRRGGHRDPVAQREVADPLLP